MGKRLLEQSRIVELVADEGLDVRRTAVRTLAFTFRGRVAFFGGGAGLRFARRRVVDGGYAAAAGLITRLLDVAEISVGTLLNSSEMVSAVLSDKSVNVAMPPETVTVTVPSRGPLPLLSEAVTCVVLSPVSRLPNWSSISTTGCVPKATPAVAVDEGWVLTTNWLAAAGLITMLFDVATVSAGRLVN